MSTVMPAVDAAAARGLLATGGILIDVRTRDEWDAGHAPEARHIPLETVPDAVAGLPRDADVVVVCRSGRRSQAAVSHLLTQGYRAHNLTGGMIAWVQAGLPVVTDSGATPAII